VQEIIGGIWSQNFENPVKQSTIGMVWMISGVLMPVM